jgi:hypothetical protein
MAVLAAELALNRFDGYPMFNLDLHEVTQSFTNAATWNRRTAASSWSTPGGSLRSSVVRGSTNGLVVGSPGADRADDIWVAEPGVDVLVSDRAGAALVGRRRDRSRVRPES